MDKDIFKGLKISFGFILGLSLLFGIVYAVGFHTADEIISGTFLGNYSYTGDVNFSLANVSGLNLGGSIPTGFVGSFNLSSCPSGWSNFTNANGRVIVGKNAGDIEFDTLLEIGGEKTHILTIAEMPSHSHSLSQFESPGSNAVNRPVTPPYNSNSNNVIIQTNSAGSGNAHNVLQPYITLLYCVKD